MREVRPEARYGRSFATDTSVLNDPARQNPARAAENRSKIERRRAREYHYATRQPAIWDMSDKIVEEMTAVKKRNELAY